MREKHRSMASGKRPTWGSSTQPGCAPRREPNSQPLWCPGRCSHRSGPLARARSSVLGSNVDLPQGSMARLSFLFSRLSYFLNNFITFHNFTYTKYLKKIAQAQTQTAFSPQLSLEYFHFPLSLLLRPEARVILPLSHGIPNWPSPSPKLSPRAVRVIFFLKIF